jgi:hypothetical protein
MYKARMKTRRMSPEISCAPGTVMDVEDSVGIQLIESGCAELISMSKIETQMVRAPENAMMPKPIAKSPVKKPVTRKR